MFAWVCPRCGRDNPPSATECQYCGQSDEPVTESVAAPPPQRIQAAPLRETPPVPAPPLRDASPAPPPPPAPDPLRAPLHHAERPVHYVAPPPPPRPHAGAGLPTWLLFLLFAFAFVGLGAAVIYGYQKFSRGGSAGFTGGEASASAPKKGASNALSKYIEVVGIRLVQDARKRPEARFVVVNHASTELNDLTANVTLWASTSRSEEDAVGSFTFKIASIAPNEAKEITTPLKTKLKIYELPDWQNETAEVQITSP